GLWSDHCPIGRAGLGSLALPPMCYEDHACSHILSFSFAGEAKGRCLMRRIGGVVLTVTGLLACPCHLINTLPLLISLLAGTALGSFLSRTTGLVYTVAGIYFAAALHAAELGKSAVMAEFRTVGGTCANRGCLPSKNLIEAARLVYDAAHPRYPGLTPVHMPFSWAKLVAQKDEIIQEYRTHKYESLL